MLLYTPTPTHSHDILTLLLLMPVYTVTYKSSFILFHFNNFTAFHKDIPKILYSLHKYISLYFAHWHDA